MKLTKVEEEVMKYIWEMERCTVTDIINKLGAPKVPHSTIASVVRILENKGFVNHKAYGRTHEYFPIISKKEYSSQSLKSVASTYFEGSVNKMLSFLIEENDLTLKDLNEIIKTIEQNKDDK